MRRVLLATLSISLAANLLPPASAAQSVDTIAVDRGRLFTQNDLYLALGFAALTVGMAPIDRSAALRLQRDPVQNRAVYKNTATAFRLLGQPVSLFTAVGMYGVGRVAHQRRLADFGLHITESMVLSSAITQTVKNLAGRARPRHFVDSTGATGFNPDPKDFQLGRGFGNGEFQSFPSGHTSAAFAFASALVAEVSKWKPGSAYWVGPIFYGGATLVGASRMYNNAHWASDVALGAAIGTFSGIKVVRFNHHHSGNRVDRALLSLKIVPGDAGATQLGLSILR